MMTCDMPTIPGRYQCLVRVKDKRLLEFRDIWLFPGEGHWRFSNTEILTVYYPAIELYRPIGHAAERYERGAAADQSLRGTSKNEKGEKAL